MATDRVFELRTYTAAPGKRDALERRFVDHTLGLFERHGIGVVGFFTPADDDGETLIYLCSFPSREAAKASWAAFQADPDWIETKRASEVDGVLAAKVESRYLDPTSYSALR
jgi:NIPSNAP